MNEFLVNPQDERLKNIQRDDFDCFTFDSLSIHELKRILKGKSVLLNRFLMKESDSELKHKEKHILSKVRLIDNIVKNDPYTKAFLVFQTISWKILKEKMPFILIPVRIFDEGTKIVRDGAPFINPVLINHIGEFDMSVSDKEIFSLDNSELTEDIEENNGRLIYEMYLTHFKVAFSGQKQKLNKRFVTIDNKIDYLEKNNDLLPMDFELINIKKSVVSGNNTLLNAKQGTKKVALLVNIISEFVARNKSVLYVSEKNYRSLRDAIKQTGLSNYIEDVLDTHYEDVVIKTEEDQVPFNQLEDIVDLLHDYQENMLTKEKGMVLSDVFAELVLLRDLPQKDGVVEFFDELTENDVNNIVETLQKLQLIIDEEQYIVPADLHWNDIDVRNVKYKEADVVKEIRNIRALLNDIQSIIKQVRSEYGILLPTTFNDIKDHVKNLDYMNSLQYPSSWFDGDAFDNAKKHINAANNIAGRTLSLDTTLTMNFKESIKKINPADIVDSLYGDYFNESHHKVMNKLLISKSYSKGEIQKLEMEVERLLYFKEKYEKEWHIKLGENFAEFIVTLSKILNNKLLSLKWLNYNEEQKQQAIDFFNKNEKQVSKYLQVRRDVRMYFTSDVDLLEDEFVKKYIEHLDSNAKKTAEVLSVFKVVDQYTYGRFSQFRKTKKIQVLNKVREYLRLAPQSLEIQTELSGILGKKVELDDFNSLSRLFKTIKEFNNPYKLNFKVNINRTNKMLTEFNKSLTTFKYIIKDSLFSSLRELPVEKLESEIDLFKAQALKLMDVEIKLKKYFKKQPDYLTVQEIRTIMRTVENFQVNSKLLSRKDQEYSLWYGSSYTGMNTAFKGVRVMLKNFTKFLSIFKSEDNARDYFKRKEYKKVNELLYSLRVKLDALEADIEEVDKYFVQPVVMNELHLLDSYLSQFSTHKHMVQWVEFTDGLQALRNFNQMRLAASINNGLVMQNIGLQFKYAFYEKMVDTYYKNYDSKDIIKKMQTFNEQNMLVHKQRILSIKNRRKKKVVLSSISGVEDSKNIYDLVIVDGAERIHSSYMQSLFATGRNVFVLFDEDSINIGDSIYNYIEHQPMYKIENNYHISPFLIQEDDIGVLFDQVIEVTNRMDVIDKVVTRLIGSEAKVNVVCSDNRERVEIYNLINSRISKMIENHEQVLPKLYVLLYDEYLPTTDVTFLLLNEENVIGVNRAINTTLKNSREVFILDEGDFLKKQEGFNGLNSSIMGMLSSVLEPLSQHVVDRLEKPYKVKRMIPPYDFVVGDEEDIYCLVKITFNNEHKSDILEETQMLFDEEYGKYQKFIISIDDLYFRHDEIIKELKEVIERGSSK